MPINEWLSAAGIMMPFGIGIYLPLLTSKPNWTIRAIAGVMLAISLCNLAAVVTNEARRNCTTILHCGLKK
jgi:hypothetical protein